MLDLVNRSARRMLADVGPYPSKRHAARSRCIAELERGGAHSEVCGVPCPAGWRRRGRLRRAPLTGRAHRPAIRAGTCLSGRVDRLDAGALHQSPDHRLECLPRHRLRRGRSARRASPTPTRRSSSPSTRSATATACSTRPPGPCLVPQGGMGCGEVRAPAAPTLPGEIGYVQVPAFSGSAEAATALANDLQRAVMSADQTDPIGWIVDVRGNGGGNMWPMIAGIGPVLGEGVAGYFIDPVGVETTSAYVTAPPGRGDIANQRVGAPLPAETRPTQGRGAHRQRGGQFRGSGGPCPSRGARIRDRSATGPVAFRPPTRRIR